jgi:hypothetical protein
MTYKEKIETAVGLIAPTAFQFYTGTADAYITYFCYNEMGELWAENVQITTGFYCQIDIWSKRRENGIESQVRTALITAGFDGLTTQDLYESDIRIYHKAIRCNYFE